MKQKIIIFGAYLLLMFGMLRIACMIDNAINNPKIVKVNDSLSITETEEPE